MGSVVYKVYGLGLQPHLHDQPHVVEVGRLWRLQLIHLSERVDPLLAGLETLLDYGEYLWSVV